LDKLKAALRNPRELAILALAAVFITINWFIYIYAVNTGQMIAGSLGYYINPLVSIALGAFVYRERFRAIEWVAIALATAGVTVMTIQVGRLPWISLVLAISFGIYGLLKKMTAVDSDVGLAVETALLLPFALAYLFLTPAAGLMGISPASAPPLAAGSPLLLTLLPLTGICTATPLMLFATGTRHLDLSMVGFLQYLAPSIMLLLGVFAYNEAFTTTHAICFGLIWVGLALYSFAKLRATQVVS
jgi:chloramphenicol-sensitive protein RarD